MAIREVTEVVLLLKPGKKAEIGPSAFRPICPKRCSGQGPGTLNSEDLRQR